MLEDLKRVEVQLYSSLFWDDKAARKADNWRSPLEHFIAQRFTNVLPMSSIALDRLDITTYMDDPARPASPDLIIVYANALHTTISQTSQEHAKHT